MDLIAGLPGEDAEMFKYIGLNNIHIEKSDLIKLKECKNDISLRLTILIHTMSNKIEAIKLLDILKYANKIKNIVLFIMQKTWFRLVGLLQRKVLSLNISIF